MEVWAPEVAARGAASRSLPTLRAYADIWLETRKTQGRGLRPTTRRQYRMLLDRFIYPTFSEERIDKFSNDDVNTWYDALAAGRETIRAQSYSLLRTVFASATGERPHPLVPYNPAQIRGAGSAKRAQHVQPATLDGHKTITAELPDRYRLVALLAAWCAMRFGELTELRRGDIDLRTGRVKVRRGVVRVDGEFIIGPPKTDAGVLDIAIPPRLIPLVKDHLSDHTAPGRESLLFPSASDDNRHMAPATRYKVFYPARDAAGRKASDGTTSPTPVLSWPHRLARRSRNLWVASATQLREPRCATSTPPQTGMPSSPDVCRSSLAHRWRNRASPRRGARRRNAVSWSCLRRSKQAGWLR